MHCPQCGKEIRDDARFCPECGAKIVDEHEEVNHGSGQPHVPGGSLDPKTRKKHRRRALIICAGVLIALVVLGVVTSAVTRTKVHNDLRLPHPVTFMISIEGYDENSSHIPVQITGTDIDGNEVDETIYLGYFGEVDAYLVKGTYHAQVLGSPITSKGKIYEIPDKGIDFELGEDLEPEEEYMSPSSEAFEFAPIKADEVTDAEIERALDWARKDESSKVDIEELERAAYKRRDDAKAGIDVDFEVHLDTEPTGIF